MGVHPAPSRAGLLTPVSGWDDGPGVLGGACVGLAESPKGGGRSMRWRFRLSARVLTAPQGSGPRCLGGGTLL